MKRAARQKSLGFLVRFDQVGRDKVCWDERIEPPVTDLKILRAIKKRKVLASRLIDVDFGDSDHVGVIIAGRVVGRVLIVPGSEVLKERGDA